MLLVLCSMLMWFSYSGFSSLYGVLFGLVSGRLLSEMVMLEVCVLGLWLMFELWMDIWVFLLFGDWVLMLGW